MPREEWPPGFLERLDGVTGKRAATVINHILEHGYITTEQIQEEYGYGHPPRAIADVREHGIPLVRSSVKSRDGRNIASYKFGDPSEVREGKFEGRTAFSKQFKQELIEVHGNRCNICLAEFEERYLQIDHRIPYRVSGEPEEPEKNLENYMLLCASCNRAKSWSCESCRNWLELKDPEICSKCYWAQPSSYEHVAMRSIRRLDVVWTDEEIEVYDSLQVQANAKGISLSAHIKSLAQREVEGHN